MTAPVIRVLQEDWADTAVPLPRYETTGAAGADIRANLLPEDRAQGFTLYPMQRAVKYGISLPNTPGTIDSDYRGPLGVLLINFGREPYVIQHGERIAQAIIAPVVQALFEITDAALTETGRGAGGFGSTGRE